MESLIQGGTRCRYVGPERYESAGEVQEEISRVESAILAVPDIEVSSDGNPIDRDAWRALQELEDRLQQLRALASTPLGKTEAKGGR